MTFVKQDGPMRRLAKVARMLFASWGRRWHEHNRRDARRLADTIARTDVLAKRVGRLFEEGNYYGEGSDRTAGVSEARAQPVPVRDVGQADDESPGAPADASVPGPGRHPPGAPVQGTHGLTPEVTHPNGPFLLTQVLALPAKVLLDLAKMVFHQQDTLNSIAELVARMVPVVDDEGSGSEGARVLAALGMGLSMAHELNKTMQVLIQAVVEEFPVAYHGPH